MHFLLKQEDALSLLLLKFALEQNTGKAKKVGELELNASPSFCLYWQS
jgi:hypothetical protein